MSWPQSSAYTSLGINYTIWFSISPLLLGMSYLALWLGPSPGSRRLYGALQFRHLYWLPYFLSPHIFLWAIAWKLIIGPGRTVTAPKKWQCHYPDSWFRPGIWNILTYDSPHITYFCLCVNIPRGPSPGQGITNIIYGAPLLALKLNLQILFSMSRLSLEAPEALSSGYGVIYPSTFITLTHTHLGASIHTTSIHSYRSTYLFTSLFKLVPISFFWSLFREV